MKTIFSNKIFLTFAICLFFTACGSKEDESESASQEVVSKLESAMTDLQSKYDDLRNSKPSEALDWAADDLKSIGDWEYKIIEFSALSVQDIEKALNKLGEERWQVFWVKEISADELQFMLKRPTVSYLSKLPLSSLGKMMLGNEGQ